MLGSFCSSLHPPSENRDFVGTANALPADLNNSENKANAKLQKAQHNALEGNNLASFAYCCETIRQGIQAIREKE
jgi:hypothetical protein